MARDSGGAHGRHSEDFRVDQIRAKGAAVLPRSNGAAFPLGRTSREGEIGTDRADSDRTPPFKPDSVEEPLAGRHAAPGFSWAYGQTPQHRPRTRQVLETISRSALPKPRGNRALKGRRLPVSEAGPGRLSPGPILSTHAAALKRQTSSGSSSSLGAVTNGVPSAASGYSKTLPS